jgi:MFS family permease
MMTRSHTNQLEDPSRDVGVLADRDFRRLFAATAASQGGFQITVLVLPLVAILALHASALQAGLLFTLMNAAFLLIGLPAGAWIDRTNRRGVLIAGDLTRALLLASVPVAWWTGLLTMWQLYAVAFLFGACTVFFDVAYQSYLPYLVGRDRLVDANAKLESVRAVAQIGGPGLGGQFVQALTAPVALLVNTVAMALSSIFVLRIRRREFRPERTRRTRLVREIADGLRFVFGEPMLRAIAATTATANFFFSAYLAMLTYFLARDLSRGPGTIGLVMAVGGAGGVLGALAAKRFTARVGQGPAILVSIVAGPPFALLMPAAAPGWRVWLGAAGLFVMFASAVIYNVVQISFRLALTPDHLLGRMNATMRFLVSGVLPLGGLFGAALGARFGARTALVVAGVGMMLAFLPVVASPIRHTRDLAGRKTATP